MPRTLTHDQQSALVDLAGAVHTASIATQNRDRRILTALDKGCPVAAVARTATLDSGTVRAIRDRRAAVGA